MFVQSEKFMDRRRGRVDSLSIYGQESNPNTWKLAQMNLAIHGLEGKIREEIIRDNLVESVIAIPAKLFYSTGIPMSLWIINRQKDQTEKTVFIDARNLGTMVTRAHRELSVEDIDKIAGAYHDFVAGNDVNQLGFAHIADLKEIEQNSFILTPGRYVGLEELEDDGEPFEEKMEKLTDELGELFAESDQLEKEIRDQLWGDWVWNITSMH